MARFDWRGDDIMRRAVAAVEDAGREIGGELVTTAQAINRAERYDTGEMTEGWHLVGVFSFGMMVRIVVQNNVYHAIFQDKGTSRIAAANISGRSMDQVAPRLPAAIAARMGT